MSTKNEQTAAPQVDHRQLLTEKVAQPAFFQKLASHGIVPQTIEEAQALLDMGARAIEHIQQGQAKVAAAQTSLIMRAHQGLQDLSRPNVDPADAAAVKIASQLVKNDPGLIQSAVAMQRASVAVA